MQSPARHGDADCFESRIASARQPEMRRGRFNLDLNKPRESAAKNQKSKPFNT
jgi:hypothetical protein